MSRIKNFTVEEREKVLSLFYDGNMFLEEIYDYCKENFWKPLSRNCIKKLFKIVNYTNI